MLRNFNQSYYLGSWNGLFVSWLRKRNSVWM